MRKPELLAPAGNMEKLQVAVHYGADAVYLGGKAFGLRAQAGNFTVAELDAATGFAHRHGVKVYLTVNIYPDNRELDGIAAYLRDIRDIPVDAVIVSDPGVIDLLREEWPSLPLHLSTQANTTNWRSARFWQARGIGRVNLARELPLEAIRAVRERVTAELEVFVHGAMCIAYSGRCLLSSVLAGRAANRGECAHPCRWRYALVEETRPGQYFPVTEEGGGTFIFNAKDLCLLPHLPELVASGVDSLKIEGRMKGIHYLASVVRVYREALDRLCENPAEYRLRPEWLDELAKVSHRGYTSGFLLGPPGEHDREFHSRYIRSYDPVGLVEEVSADGALLVGVRNRLCAGDEVEIMGRAMRTERIRLEEFTSTDGEPLTVAHPNQRIRLRVPVPAERFDLLRREKRPETASAAGRDGD